MGILRAGYRLLLFAVCTLLMVVLYAISGIGRSDRFRNGIRWRRWWIDHVPRWMGIRMHVKVPCLPQEAALYMCNHRSYLDPVIALSRVNAVVVAKQEVASWPLIGLAARVAGVIFVKRDDDGNRKHVVDAMLGALQTGLPVLNFPEGTTSAAPALESFRKGAFRMAGSHGIPVIPVALEYAHERDAWIDNDTFLRHFFQMFARRRIHVYMRYGPVLSSPDAEWLAACTHRWIRGTLDCLKHQMVDK